MSWPSLIEDSLRRVAAEGRWRSPRTFDARGPAGVLEDGQRAVVSFASNDYLGLSTHPAVIAAARDAAERWGTGAGASRLVTGSRPVHAALEEAIARWKGTEAAICFPTGYAANLGVLSGLGGLAGHIVSDELNHASIIDGCRLARAPVSVYRHADPEHVAALLEQGPASRSGRGPAGSTRADGGAGQVGPAIVVTDSVFSMDGDVAPLAELATLCERRGALLVVDEAHAVLGPELSPAQLEGALAVRVGTLSKTLGSLGGFVAGPRAVVDLLVNSARPYIFTTAPSPADAAAARAALEVLQSDEGEERRNRLATLVDRVAPGHGTPIVPVVLGPEERAVAASAELLERGLWVPAIRPPTVPPGTSRLRVTLSALHTDEQVSSLMASLSGLTALGTGGQVGPGGPVGPGGQVGRSPLAGAGVSARA